MQPCVRRILIGLLLVLTLAPALCQAQLRGWQRGRGWGLVWGPKDEVGSLNALDEKTTLAALQLVRAGKVYDLGLRIDRTSFKWPGHSPIEVTTFRTPEGVKRQLDFSFFTPESNRNKVAFHSCALFISDNVGTQIDSLGHITSGDDNHWYNRFREGEWGGDFGLRKADADSIPPIIARAVLIDVAGWKKVDALPANFAIGPEELKATLAWEKEDVEPGEVVLIRTGTARYWGETGSDHARLAAHDSAGLTLAGARWLVEQKGAILIGADTTGLEVGQDPAAPGRAIPVHEYLLVEQGVHIGELHNLEGLASDHVYRFAYIAVTNRIKGATAGFALRPLALR